MTTQVYGRIANGAPCKTCQKVGGYCSKHSDQKPGIIQSMSMPAVDTYRERVNAKLRGETVAPLSEAMDLIGALRGIQFGIDGIQKSIAEQEQELRDAKKRIAEQEQREEKQRQYMEKIHQMLENVQDRFSEQEKAQAQAKFANDAANASNLSSADMALQKMSNREVIRAEPRKPLRWNADHLPIILHDEAYMVLNNNNPYEVFDNMECIVVSLADYKNGLLIPSDRLAGGLPKSVYDEALNTVRFTKAGKEKRRAASAGDNGNFEKSEISEVNHKARMNQIDAKHGIVHRAG